MVKYMQSHNTRIDTIGACDCYTLDIPGSNPKSKYYRTKNVFFFAPYLENSDCNYVLPAGRYLSMTYRGDLTKTRELLPLLTLFSKNCIYRYSPMNSSVSYGVITIYHAHSPLCHYSDTTQCQTQCQHPPCCPPALLCP